MRWLKKLLLINIILSITVLSAMYCATYSCLHRVYFWYSSHFNKPCFVEGGLYKGYGLTSYPYDYDDAEKAFKELKSMGASVVLFSVERGYMSKYLDIAKSLNLVTGIIIPLDYANESSSFNLTKNVSLEKVNIVLLKIGNTSFYLSGKDAKQVLSNRYKFKGSVGIVVPYLLIHNNITYAISLANEYDLIAIEYYALSNEEERLIEDIKRLSEKGITNLYVVVKGDKLPDIPNPRLSLLNENKAENSTYLKLKLEKILSDYLSALWIKC